MSTTNPKPELGAADVISITSIKLRLDQLVPALLNRANEATVTANALDRTRRQDLASLAADREAEDNLIAIERRQEDAARATRRQEEDAAFEAGSTRTDEAQIAAGGAAALLERMQGATSVLEILQSTLTMQPADFLTPRQQALTALLELITYAWKLDPDSEGSAEAFQEIQVALARLRGRVG